ncbi:MAG: hypothetical protein NHB15_14905 [Methanosarcina barkeri]|nr:hypothetical protein [Methanosarcina sp. ERenArc_MAG2]
MKNSESNDSEDWECEEVSQYRATRAEDQTDDNLIGVIWSKKYGLRPDFVQTWKYILSTPMLFKSDMDRARLGLIKIEDHPERLQRYSVFESVYILVGGA